jgi:hypothetical protein
MRDIKELIWLMAPQVLALAQVPLQAQVPAQVPALKPEWELWRGLAPALARWDPSRDPRASSPAFLQFQIALRTSHRF